MGKKHQSSLAKTAADKTAADKTAAAEETAAGQAAADETAAAEETAAGQAAADKTAAEPTLERKVKRPKSAQAAAVETARSQRWSARSSRSWSVEARSPPSEPGHGHEMPSNFDAACLLAWQSLPAEILPCPAQCKGRLSYTIRSPNGATVEVQLGSRAFLYKKLKGGKAFLDHPFTHAWTKHGDVVQAWKACKAALGWDD